MNPHKPIEILLIDDHPIVRLGFVALLGKLGQTLTVHEAANQVEALALAAKYAPTVALLDLSLGGELSLNLIRIEKSGHGGSPQSFSQHD